MDVQVSKATWGVGLGGMEVGVARPTRIVGLGGTCVELAVSPEIGKTQLIKSRAGMTKALIIIVGLDWKNGCLGVMDHSSFRTLHNSIDIFSGIKYYLSVKKFTFSCQYISLLRYFLLS